MKIRICRDATLASGLYSITTKLRKTAILYKSSKASATSYSLGCLLKNFQEQIYKSLDIKVKSPRENISQRNIKKEASRVSSAQQTSNVATPHLKALQIYKSHQKSQYVGIENVVNH